MISLSVIILTLNEERNIARCLESIKAVADEILVVDSYSIDRTREICSSFGARVVEHPFEGHIQQKNFALTLTSSPYVLALDADEALTPDLRASILAAKSHWDRDAYAMNRRTNYCGAWILHGAWYPDRKVRLFDARKGSWKGTNPHDRFELDSPASTVGHLEGDLLHYSYYSISGHIQQVDYFTTISAEQLRVNGARVSLARMVVAPFVRFLRDYVVRGGFLDGYYGFIIAIISSHAVFLKHVKLRQLINQDGTS